MNSFTPHYELFRVCTLCDFSLTSSLTKKRIIGVQQSVHCPCTRPFPDGFLKYTFPSPSQLSNAALIVDATTITLEVISFEAIICKVYALSVQDVQVMRSGVYHTFGDPILSKLIPL